ncbi:MAG TPA: NAD(P)-dependent alcohol dehydrogenase [Gemmatimonadales bacterium]|jgi:uncharacterized zinc-type alcohol dehydrogenase-like protein|nr:NAD(P)-dependent alcohol dehydrogenase [Gemmatimonadales bacterium]
MPTTPSRKGPATRLADLEPQLTTPAFAAPSARAPLAPFQIARRQPGPHEVLIDILYCGVCHTDIHQVRDEWGGGRGVFPMVPGHEIIGRVARAGEAVTRWKTGDTVGVGCLVDSCRECEACRAGAEQYCEGEGGPTFTYGGTERDGTTPTYGGYSTRITVDGAYVVGIPKGLPLPGAAPLLCAGITTYSPLHAFGVQRGDRVAVVGLGGLGHIAVKIASAMGARVAVVSHSPAKREDARRLGAEEFLVVRSADDVARQAGRFDLVLDTVSARHDYAAGLELLRRDGTMVLVGLPEPSPLEARPLIQRRRRLAGSMIGGIRETQEMLDFCGREGITAEVEQIPIQGINEAYERMLRSDVRYRFVIDLASLRKS